MTTLTVPKRQLFAFSEDELELVIDSLDYYMQHNIKVMPRPLQEKKDILTKLTNILTKLY